jgi:type I restriction enzyme S subunit
MTWLTAPLRKVAPPVTAQLAFNPDEKVWQLSLDQIESGTGEIVGKRYAPASDAGSSTFCFDTGNVLYSKLRPYLNKVSIPDEPGIATTELIPLRPNPKTLNSSFLAYYLRSPGFVNQASHHVAGAKMPRVVMDWFWEHEAPLPPPKEQSRIVELLDEANRLRRLCREADAKAARILPVLFEKNFGKPFQDGVWPVVPLGNLVSTMRNGTTNEQNTLGKGYPVTRIETISAGVINPRRVRYLDITREEAIKWLLQKGDILFSHINSETHIGKTAIYHGTPEFLIHGMNLLLLRADVLKVDPTYLFAFLNTPEVRTFYRSRCKRAVNQASLNQKDISSLPVPLPPLEEQKKFTTLSNKIEGVLGGQTVTTEKLDKLFELILKHTFSGQLTATWREAHMKELLAEMEHQARLLNLTFSTMLPVNGIIGDNAP